MPTNKLRTKTTGKRSRPAAHAKRKQPAAAAKAAEKPHVGAQAQPMTKVASVVALAQRKDGVTLEQIAKQLKVSGVAAGSLIGDARRKGVKIDFADGVYRAV